MQRTNPGPGRRRGVSCFQALFGFVFCALGLAACGVLTWTWIQENRTRFWEKTPCTIIDGRIEEASDHQGGFSFRPRIRYSYEFGGKPYISDRVAPTEVIEDDYADAQELLDAFPAGNAAFCRVDPGDPAQAVLRHGSPWTILIALFPLIFVAIGLGVMRGGRTDDGKETAPISSTSSRTLPPWAVRLLFGVFALVGMGIGWSLFVVPAINIHRSASWKRVPCTVLQSQVRTHSGDDGDTYSVNILYSYEWNGRPYKSNRYDFFQGSSGGYLSKQAIVNKHPAGHRTTCLINPDQPREAVLTREASGNLLPGLIPLLFFMVGSAGLLLYRGEAPAASACLPRGRTAIHPAGGPVILHSKIGPGLRVAVSIGICLLWNGILTIPASEILQSFQKGRPEWFMAVFMTPFFLVGLGMAGYVIYTALAYFNPRIEIAVGASAVPLGGEIRLKWRLHGRAGRIRKFLLGIEASEAATYRRGTSTVTDTEVFFRQIVFESEDPREFSSGKAVFAIPRNSMHSFDAPNNKIVWELVVTGEIPRWPDLGERFELTILPLPAEQENSGDA
ncbi:MAG TPA: DUF3592 domain-containing protein [Candidatus Ozemobacteraceae bacterium]|nr:DUF3592 domain-containing protein [Candidatus Ozemobacteraceae bacterium]